MKKLEELSKKELREIEGGKPLMYHISFAISYWMIKAQDCGMGAIPF